MEKRGALLFFSIAFFAIAAITFFDTKAYEGAKKPHAIENKGVVVVDAGHGGGDPGKVSPDGILEKDLNLEIAKKLRDELNARGYEVIMTREDDNWLSDYGVKNKKKSDMYNRVSLINKSCATYLISIHQNSYTQASIKGAQVFYYGGSEAGKNLAEAIQKNIKETVDTENNRAIKEGNEYYILKKSNCAGVILECGFLSNPEETAKLCDSVYQQKLACAVADAIGSMR